jgi:hypothetical protein
MEDIKKDLNKIKVQQDEAEEESFCKVFLIFCLKTFSLPPHVNYQREHQLLYVYF